MLMLMLMLVLVLVLVLVLGLGLVQRDQFGCIQRQFVYGTNITVLQVAFDYEHEHRFTEHEQGFIEHAHGAAKPIQIKTSH
ncbi:MAG: hypothetical protein RL240_4366 [Planctomycetota bacterium]